MRRASDGAVWDIVGVERGSTVGLLVRGPSAAMPDDDVTLECVAHVGHWAELERWRALALAWEQADDSGALAARAGLLGLGIDPQTGTCGARSPTHVLTPMGFLAVGLADGYWYVVHGSGVLRRCSTREEAVQVANRCDRLLSRWKGPRIAT
jgi:hypothetical protein